ncbi:Yos1 family protein [Toxoplasma gondii MAS]|uniref:Yos1 family protein n=6 Tax=Toxoplasma gondii TaxID=5811 RepID=A0A086QHH5_TOXGO|nr:Yos1 family protein [Toxoplasma gondii MAS]PUA90100.1 Yos1 family protein [Toxoplasma gondii TgCATBr9]
MRGFHRCALQKKHEGKATGTDRSEVERKERRNSCLAIGQPSMSTVAGVHATSENAFYDEALVYTRLVESPSRILTMAFTLLHLLESFLLLLNAAAVLSAPRLLRPLGLDKPQVGDPGFRSQISLFLFSVRTYLKLPLVVANLVVIVFELLFG